MESRIANSYMEKSEQAALQSSWNKPSYWLRNVMMLSSFIITAKRSIRTFQHTSVVYTRVSRPQVGCAGYEDGYSRDTNTLYECFLRKESNHNLEQKPAVVKIC